VIVYVRSVHPKYHAGEVASSLFKDCGCGGGHADMGRSECDVESLGWPVKELEAHLASIVKKLRPK
jgi:hypothetical protein